MRVVWILYLVCAVAAALVDKPRAELRAEGSLETEITWPGSFSLSYRLSLPLSSEYQDEQVEYVVHYARRGGDGGARVKVASGANTHVFLAQDNVAQDNVEYVIHPRMDSLVCERLVGVGEGIDVGVPLPDLSGWESLGVGWVGEREAKIFERIVTTGGRRMEYRFYVSTEDEARPLRLHMIGREIFSGAHYDEYLIEYLSYSAERPECTSLMFQSRFVRHLRRRAWCHVVLKCRRCSQSCRNRYRRLELGVRGGLKRTRSLCGSIRGIIAR